MAKKSRLKSGLYINNDTGSYWLKFPDTPIIAVCKSCIKILASGRLHDPFCDECCKLNTRERTLARQSGKEMNLTKTDLPLEKSSS